MVIRVSIQICRIIEGLQSDVSWWDGQGVGRVAIGIFQPRSGTIKTRKRWTID